MITTTATSSIERHSGAAAWGAVGLFASVAVILVAAALAAQPHPPLNAVFQGSTADIGQYPWMASLRFDGQHNCGAVVVTDRMLLTAAHCVASYPKSHLSVIIGTDKPDWGHSTPISVVDTYIEPGYVAPGASYDVAVIALDRRVSSPTATLMLDAAPPVGASAEIIGWGCTLDPQVGKAACGEPAAKPPSLQAGWMKIVDNRLCHHFLPAYSDAIWRTRLSLRGSPRPAATSTKGRLVATTPRAIEQNRRRRSTSTSGRNRERVQGMGWRCVLPRGWLGDENFPAGPVCSCAESGDGLWFHRRGCEASVHPFVDEQTLALVVDAVESLVRLRGSGPGDAGAVLSALASVIAEAQSRLPDAVADARERDRPSGSWLSTCVTENT